MNIFYILKYVFQNSDRGSIFQGYYLLNKARKRCIMLWYDGAVYEYIYTYIHTYTDYNCILGMCITPL